MALLSLIDGDDDDDSNKKFSVRLPSHVRSATALHTIPTLCVTVSECVCAVCISDLSILERILHHFHQPSLHAMPSHIDAGLNRLEVLLPFHPLLLLLLIRFLLFLLPFLYTIFISFIRIFSVHRLLSLLLLSH